MYFKPSSSTCWIKQVRNRVASHHSAGGGAVQIVDHSSVDRFNRRWISGRADGFLCAVTVCRWWRVLTRRKWEEILAGKWAVVMPLSTNHQALHQHCSFQQLYKMIIHRLEAVFIVWLACCLLGQSLSLFTSIYAVFPSIEDCCKSTIQQFDLLIDLLLTTHFLIIFDSLGPTCTQYAVLLRQSII